VRRLKSLGRLGWRLLLLRNCECGLVSACPSERADQQKFAPTAKLLASETWCLPLAGWQVAAMLRAWQHGCIGTRHHPAAEPSGIGPASETDACEHLVAVVVV
jgi:hypothetical protein